MSGRLAELLAIMRRLRAADGCPWDREQTFASIAPYTVEEAYEVADAAERGDLPHLMDELGDLLFQVVFHAQLAAEAGAFDFDDVVAAIGAKLVRRHPHLFGDAAPVTLAEQSQVWENIKAAERESAAGSAPVSVLEGVPLALPALLRAHKLSQRAARVGFDFPHASQTADKVAEELAEVREAVALADAAAAASAAAVAHAVTADAAAAPSPHVVEEMGDLLFAAANLARKLGVDAEAALRAANGKFERRFHGMERLAAARGEAFEGLDLAAQVALWQAVKRGE